jgi:histidinol-phosphate aminotransferase
VTETETRDLPAGAAPPNGDAGPERYDLSMNETPYPPPEALRRVVEEAARATQRYPDNTAADLVAGLARQLAVPAPHVLVGPGSAGLAQFLLAAAAGGGEVVHAAPSFEAYPLLIANAGARPVPVPLAAYRHDLPAMAEAVTPGTRCVLICNPNNPTGTLLSRAELEAFLDRIPPEVVVIIDEAYREFVTDPAAPDALDLHRNRPNVCVLRTFSKAYGLAGLRIGYAVAPPELATRARLLGMVFFPGAAAQAAALAALRPDTVAEVTARCATLARTRDELAVALGELGLPVVPSQANFLWLPLGEQSAPFAAHLARHGITVRAHPGAGVRITVGTPRAHHRLLAAVRGYPGESPCGS